MKRKHIKELITWFAAIVISFMIANFFLSFYFYDPGWIKRDTGATAGIYEPGSRIIRADEGFTITGIDENGYINQNADLTESGYILVMGNSQSNGSNVMPRKKWISLLNDKIQNARNEDSTQVYNLSVGGYQLCDQIRGVKAAMEEFPDSSALIIQITTTDVSPDELNTIEQREFTEEARGQYLANHLSYMQICRNGIKDFFPLVIYISELKLSKIDFTFKNAFFHGKINNGATSKNSPGEGIADEEQKFIESLNDSLVFLKNTYHGEIIILNIPAISLQSDGSVVVNKGKYEDLFKAACEQNDICYLQMGEIYIKEYNEKNILPYGFSNTQPGTGHLNTDGHQMVANALYYLLEEREVVK